MELKTIAAFRDKTNPDKTYKVGEAIQIEDLDRINDLVARSLCVITSVNDTTNNDGGDDGSGKTMPLFEKEFEVEAVKEALKAIGVQVAHKAGVTGVTKKISELTDEQKTALAETLNKE